MVVGREAERRAIENLLAGARVGTSGVLVITGEPGIGKTCLLSDAERHTHQMTVLRARGIESEQAVPFGGLLQLLRPLLPGIDQIPAPQAEALSSALMLDTRGTSDPSRFAVGAATLSLLSRAAEERPVAVLLDDAHVLDGPSTEALVFAARRFVSDAVAMLVTTRPTEPGSRSWGDLPPLHLTGLDLAQARSLVMADSGTDLRTEQAERLHRATAGNPLALLELGRRLDRLDARPADTPVRVSEELTSSFLGRVEELPPETRLALLVVAADSTSVASVHGACRALGLTGAALASATDAGLIDMEGDQIAFRHPLVRSAVYGAADSETRREVHRALTTVVPRTETDRFAWHLAEGAVAPDAQVAATLDDVGALASQRGAFATAAHAHERAAELTEGIEEVARRLTDAGRAALRAGSTDRALELLDRALERHPSPGLRSRIQGLRGAIQTRCGSLREARQTLVGAAEDVEETDPTTAVRLLCDAVHVCFYLADPTSALATARRIGELIERADDPRSRFLAAIATGTAEILAGEGVSGARHLRVALDLVLEVEELQTDRFLLPYRMIGILWLREADTHRAVVDEAVSRLRKRVALGTLPHLLMHVARDDAGGDRWDDAEASYQESIRLAEETGQSTDLATSQAGLAWLYARQGRAEQCRELARPGAELCERLGINLGSAWLDFAQGDLESGEGNVAAAVEHYERLLTRLRQAEFCDPDMSAAPELVEAYLHLKRRDQAAGLAEDFHRAANAKGQPWAIARARRALGLVARADDMDALFRSALELHARTPDLYETARTELAYGARLRRLRRRVEAREPLRSALAGFESLGARPWADAAARELEATGEQAHRREASALSELTPQERQISRLLASGHTTREAAAALFLSPKTVEYHLRHVYLKLEINSREALAEAFGR